MPTNPYNQYDHETVREAAKAFMARHKVKSLVMTDPKFLEYLAIFDAAQNNDGDYLDYSHPDMDPGSERAIELRNDAWARWNTSYEEEQHEREGMAEWDYQMEKLKLEAALEAEIDSHHTYPDC